MEARIAACLALVVIACTGRDPPSPTGMLRSLLSESPGMDPIFGPVTTTRMAGQPVASLFAFRNCEPLAQYKLHVENGADGAMERATSGRILLNGIEVVGPGDLKKSVAVLDRSITTAVDNQLAVTLDGKPGSGVRLSVTCTDHCLNVTLARPASGEPLLGPSVIVQGAVQSSSDGVGVSLNGSAAFMRDSSFSARLANNAGAWTVTARATNWCGNTATDAVTVNGIATMGPVLAASPGAVFKGEITTFQLSEMPTPIPSMTIDWDLDGDGAPEFTTQTTDPVTHKYAIAGIFIPIATIRMAGCPAITVTTVVSVMDTAELTAIATIAWGRLKASGLRSDSAEVLSFLTSRARDRYADSFNRLGPALPRIFAALSGDLHVRELRYPELHCDTVAGYGSTMKVVHSITLNIDRDGLWRFSSL